MWAKLFRGGGGVAVVSRRLRRHHQRHRSSRGLIVSILILNFYKKQFLQKYWNWQRFFFFSPHLQLECKGSTMHLCLNHITPHFISHLVLHSHSWLFSSSWILSHFAISLSLSFFLLLFFFFNYLLLVLFWVYHCCLYVNHCVNNFFCDPHTVLTLGPCHFFADVHLTLLNRTNLIHTI